MKRRTAIAIVAFVVVIALGAGYYLGRASHRTASSVAGDVSTTQGKQIYTCSMHPQVRLDQPGNCPICEMPLIPAASASAAAGEAPMLQLSEHAVAMASVETVAVERKTLSRELRAVGRIEYNESSLATITPRVDGYAERLFVNFTGVEIRKGDHLAEVYSPELLLAEQELLIALQSGAGVGGGDALTEVAKTKLRLLGLTDEQIANLIEKKQTTDRVTLYSPISGTVIEKGIVEKAAFKAGDALYRIANLDTVWVYLEIYEYDLPWVRYGQKVRLTAQAVPGRTFEGLVTFVQPIVNEQSRTIRVPVHVDNQDHALKPGMFVTALIDAVLTNEGRAAPTGVEGKYSCPMHPQVLQDADGLCPICEMPLEQIPAATSHMHDASTSKEAYMCPMRCEGDKIYADEGQCPVCEMDLVPLGSSYLEQALPHQQQMTGTTTPVYFCPMKCEGEKTYDSAGNCPVCNMKLKEVPVATEVIRAGPGTLAVPVSAVLDSGTRQIVYVEKSGGLFEPRQLTLGPRAGEYFAVLAGLTEGERVVTRGNFLIDSQFQITGHPSLFYPGGLHAASGGMGHQHGATAAPEGANSPATKSDKPPQASQPADHEH